MNQISSYCRHLPPVLWTPDTDPSLFLGRMLCIFEKILSRRLVATRLARAEAPFTQAAGNLIEMVTPAGAAHFRVGDTVTIVGSPERRVVQEVSGTDLLLTAALAGAYLGGAVRLADLIPGQLTFRVEEDRGLGAHTVIKISQAGSEEVLVVQDCQAELVTTAAGLVRSYNLAPDAVPVLVADGIDLVHGDHNHESLEESLPKLHRVFNPWRTRADFLPWLASWVALALRPDWSEYQSRKLILAMPAIYQQRGLKEGLHTYLDIYVSTKSQPRIALDDGEALFRGVLQDDGRVALHAVAYSHTVSPGAGLLTVLLHPAAVAVDGANHYLVADQGDVSLVVPRPPALWRLNSTGEVPYVAGPPLPMPRPMHQGAPLVAPVAVTVDGSDRVSVLDMGTILSAVSQRAAIHRLPPPAYTLATVIAHNTVPALPVVHPVDMVLDGAGNFVILDRGVHPLGDPPAGPSLPKIVVVSEGPLAVAQHPLATVAEPTALVLEAAGSFIVADARDQYTGTPADLVRVDPAAGWTATSLLAGMAAADNPLVFPTGLALESPSSLLVCDTGLRWGYNTMDADPAYRYLAEPAALYRVDLSQAPPVITRISVIRRLVQPTKMAWDRRGRLIISDRGESLRSLPQRNWRAGTGEFGVVLHFSRQRPTTLAERNVIRRGVVTVVNEQKPGNTSGWMDF